MNYKQCTPSPSPLDAFEKYMRSKGLLEKVISRHAENLDLYINFYLEQPNDCFKPTDFDGFVVWYKRRIWETDFAINSLRRSFAVFEQFKKSNTTI